MNDNELEIAELEAALKESKAANRRLGDTIERQSELIAALRNEIDTWRNGFNAANEALHFASQRIAELETQLAATLTTIEAALPDGRTYSEGCTP